ncbi:MAG: hypothetical protein HOB84_03620 [Candidatus Marinimicrobia bacterium]|jgi:hypothetical protein|nr:hypothetical protein [Candidatus Neomarinimicrobiota bacterium]MBT4713841.1 hypothetical protein [Candidatus Neomarinimicrobiota bacterium]MBT5271479.1 hypothetical protein [Candidatus Neomarinimicrobiota bacterium]
MFITKQQNDGSNAMTKEKWDNQERNVKDGPFSWTNKMSLRIIRRELHKKGIKRASTILMIYYALTEIASNQEKERFQCKQAEIARLAGCGVSTVNRGLRVLEDIGSIEVVRNPISVREYGIPYFLSPANTYTLLRVGRMYSLNGRKDGYANNAHYNK